MNDRSQSTTTKQAGLIPVTLHLLAGGERGGFLSSFSAGQDRLLLIPADAGDVAGGDIGIGDVIPVPSLAYVAFCKGSDAQAQEPDRGSLVPVRVQVQTGEGILVIASVTALEHPIGFFGFPVDLDGPDQGYFFYQHGIRFKQPLDGSGVTLTEQEIIDHLDFGGELGSEAPQPPVTEDPLAAKRRHRRRLGQVLAAEGWCSIEEVEAALAIQAANREKKLGQVLVEMGVLSELEVTRALGSTFDLPVINLDEFPFDPAALYAVPQDLIKQHRFLPVSMDDKTVSVVIDDPLGATFYDTLRFATKRTVVVYVAPPTQLQQYLETSLMLISAVAAGDALKSRAADEVAVGSESIRQIMEDLEHEFGGLDEAASRAKAEINDVNSNIVRLADQIIVDAQERGASDIHIEPRGDFRPCRVRFRIDGSCVPYLNAPPPLRFALVQRFKIMAKLDISEKRVPQDGKIRYTGPKGAQELRVATIPTVGDNEDVIMRLLGSSKPLPLHEMGFSRRNLEGFKSIISKPYGIVLVVGPTGSGKTTTLHSALGFINTPHRKIWTAEDPVEITQLGLRQLQVQPKIGLTFARAMRAFLRADPDVIMVGEMRDMETASTAIEASLTGHLVLSTLHTNTAPETVTRLLDMGLDPFNFSDALLGVLAQRLVKRLCGTCKKQYRPDVKEIDTLLTANGSQEWPVDTGSGRPQLWRAVGCAVCGGLGYRGRAAIHELMIATPGVKELVLRRRPVSEIRDRAQQEGMKSLMQDGIEKVCQGVTDLAQVMSVAMR
ncbi:MAG: type II/IV secretion system protein [Candidatus Schekmanbacteria bacterium]|nr:type II/IV secretion system protein [Candidatus Schekmanbacteria bacterium]